MKAGGRRNGIRLRRLSGIFLRSFISLRGCRRSQRSVSPLCCVYVGLMLRAEHGNKMRRTVAFDVHLCRTGESHLRRRTSLRLNLRCITRNDRALIPDLQSILLESLSWDHLKINASWLLGSGGTVFLDFIVLGKLSRPPPHIARLIRGEF